MAMELVFRVLLSTILVLGLIKGLAYFLSKYGPSALSGNSATKNGLVKEPRRRRLRLIETLPLPGGVILYIVSVGDKYVLMASSRNGLQLIDVSSSLLQQEEATIGEGDRTS